MLKVFGADICKDCLAMKECFAEKEIAYEYTDITESTANMKEFLAIRDRHPMFAEVREGGGIGIPLFVNLHW